jgi:hypothetical protein
MEGEILLPCFVKKKTKVSLIDKILFGKQFLESLPIDVPQKTYHKKLG